LLLRLAAGNSGSGPAEARAFDTWKSVVRSQDLIDPEMGTEVSTSKSGSGRFLQ
jgi:hypothetical protein